MFSPIEKFDVVNFRYFGLADLVDFSLTNMSLYLIFVVVTVVGFLSFFVFNGRLVPSFMQLCIEQLVKFVLGLIEKQIGVKGFIFFPFVLALFLLVLFSNLYGILPFSFSPTSHILVTFFFSMMV
jgi:F-type H+-transporting ATPase subunit a